MIMVLVAIGKYKLFINLCLLMFLKLQVYFN